MIGIRAAHRQISNGIIIVIRDRIWEIGGVRCDTSYHCEVINSTRVFAKVRF